MKIYIYNIMYLQTGITAVHASAHTKIPRALDNVHDAKRISTGVLLECNRERKSSLVVEGSRCRQVMNIARIKCHKMVLA